MADPYQLQELEALFHEALEQEPGARDDYLARRCQGRAELYRDVQRLLERDEHAEERLRSPLDVPAAAPQPGERFGAYEILDLLGRGGMGEVWLARRADGAFERKVAIKFMRASLKASAAIRFEQERQIQAQLEHPGIARLLDAGHDSGRAAVLRRRARRGDPR